MHAPGQVRQHLAHVLGIHLGACLALLAFAVRVAGIRPIDRICNDTKRHFKQGRDACGCWLGA